MSENYGTAEDNSKSMKEVRVWCDGCYDLVHFGHANSLRQAKALGKKLVVGIHTNDEIAKHKRPPVFTEEERVKMLRGIKWVDEVVLGAPYVTTLEVLDSNNCDFCVHGDDLTLTDEGVDTYELVKNANRYKEIKRTAGISTTDLVNRIVRDKGRGDSLKQQAESSTSISPWTGCNKFLLSTLKIVQFSDGKSPRPNDEIVYVAGAFDLFHVGHLDFLQKAKEQGDYLIVGLHADPVVNSYKGSNYPIMNLHERVLSVLASRYVNDVIIGAPYCIDDDLLDHFKVNKVCHGQTPIALAADKQDPYDIPKKRSIFTLVDSGNKTTTEEIVKRIKGHSAEYERLNQNKERKEVEALELTKQSLRAG